MRQVIALADRDWLDILTQLRHSFSLESWKKHGSSLLLLAMLLSVLGLIITPIQSIFLSTETIKIPTKPQKISYLLDLTDKARSEADGNSITVMTRNALKIAAITEPQVQLWALVHPVIRFPDDINSPAIYGSLGFTMPVPVWETHGATCLSCPIHFWRSYRLNSTRASFDNLRRGSIPPRGMRNITADEFPANCDRLDGGFFAEYANTTDLRYDDWFWGVQACMPDDVTQSPWKATRDRQNFSEVLYLNITLRGYYSGATSDATYYGLKLHTTAGYFALPNYMNGGVAGPLLDKDPSELLCNSDCADQGSIPYVYIYLAFETNSTTRLTPAGATKSRAATPLSTGHPRSSPRQRTSPDHRHRPLSGEGLLHFTSRTRHQSAYASTSPPFFETLSDSQIASACIDTVPLGPLLDSVTTIGNINRRITNRDGVVQGWNVDDQIADWLRGFNYGIDPLTRVFTAAAFFANKEWMRGRTIYRDDRTLTISHNMGSDLKVPAISLAGVILVSILLGVHVLALLVLGGYSSWSVPAGLEPSTPSPWCPWPLLSIHR
ncbi:hypothetical protein BDW68DRAFT_177535 [Aspergillus falconensis]